VFKGNPDVNGDVVSSKIKKADLAYDLNLCYERTPSKHIIDAYAESIFEDSNFDKTCMLFPSSGDQLAADSLLSYEGISPKEKFIAVHLGITGRNRTFPPQFWEPIIRGIVAMGIKVVSLGTMRDYAIKGNPDLRSQLSLHQNACLLKRAACFVGNDSGLVHVAGTTDVPIVALYTSAKAEYRLPYRNGELGGGCYPIKTPLECYGCLELEPPPVVTNGCRRGDYACVLGSIDPSIVLEKIREVVK
jgi:ADP-heptose:LPS heptosyltransferase